MILKNSRLVPELCEGFKEEYADIRIEDKCIAEILPAGGDYIGEEVIDCTGMTVLPGLFDLHVHLNFPDDFDWEKLKNGTQSSSAFKAFQCASSYLAYGYTSLRDVGSIHNSVIELRNKINAGLIVGPDIKTSGMVITPDTDGAPTLCSNHYGRAANNAEQLQSEARRELANGADFIKILGCRSLPSPRIKDFFGLGGPLYSQSELKALKEVTDLEQTYIAAHSCTTTSNDSLLDAGVRSIEHAQCWTQENNDKFIANGMKACLVPTLSICAFLGEDYVKNVCTGVRMAYEAGALIGFGTDNGEAMFLRSPQSEFLLRSKTWGIPNVEIIKQATINSAKINQTDDLRGSIKVGKRADFAIFKGNPDEDLNIFGNPCEYVFKDGDLVATHGLVKLHLNQLAVPNKQDVESISDF